MFLPLPLSQTFCTPPNLPNPQFTIRPSPLELPAILRHDFERKNEGSVLHS
jgi:hypothetical protein